jgi:hypothetical protein
VFSGNVRLRDDERAPSLAAIALAGCPWWLAHRLGDALQHRTQLEVTPAVTAGRPSYRVRVGRGAHRFDLFVGRKTFAPIAIRVAGRYGGWARLRPGSFGDVVRVERFFAAVSKPEQDAL